MLIYSTELLSYVYMQQFCPFLQYNMFSWYINNSFSSNRTSCLWLTRIINNITPLEQSEYFSRCSVTKAYSFFHIFCFFVSCYNISTSEHVVISIINKESLLVSISRVLCFITHCVRLDKLLTCSSNCKTRDTLTFQPYLMVLRCCVCNFLPIRVWWYN